MSSITQGGINRVPTQSGTAIPAGGAVTFVGGAGIVTSAVGSTVTITGAGGIGFVQTLTPDSGGPIAPVADNINIFGGTGITTTGAGHTITISTTGVTTMNYTLVNTTPYTVLLTDDFIGVDCSGSPITIKLPNAPATGRNWVIKDITGSAATNNITVTTVGGAVLIDGSVSYAMNTNLEAVVVLFSGSAYYIF